MIGSKLFCKAVSIAQESDERDLLDALFLHECCEALLAELLTIVPQVPLPAVCPGQKSARVGPVPGTFPFFRPAGSYPHPQIKVCVSGGETGISVFLKCSRDVHLGT